MPLVGELDSSVITVESGGAATFVLTLANDGDATETVRVRVEGDAARFAWISPEQLTVDAGERRGVRIGFRLPKTATIAAGQLPFRVRNGSGGAVLAEGAVEVLPYAALSATLDPIEGSGSPSRHELRVTTRGNAPVDVELTVTAGNGLTARVEPPSVRVAPEQPGSAVVEVAPLGRPMAGAGRMGSFTVVAKPSGGEPVDVRGTYRQKAMVSGRTVAVVGAVVGALILAGLGVRLVASGGEEATDATPPPQPVDARTRCPAEFHFDPVGLQRSLDPDDIKGLPDDYSFLRIKEDKCSPVRMNPCQPVHFVQNAAAAPPGAADDVRQSFRMLSEATGIEFVDDGITDETNRTDPYVPDRYGGRWAPILIVWEHFPAERTDGPVQILGNTVVMRVEDTVVSGRLRFNVDAYNDEQTRAPIQSGFGPPGPSTTEPIGRNNITWGRIVLHELAHLAGLGHNRSQGSLMYPDAAQQTIRPVGFSDGDRAGLRLLGREAGCLRTPPLPT